MRSPEENTVPRTALVPAILLTALVTACAPGPSAAPGMETAAARPTPRPCFEPDRVINFRAGETQQLYLRVLGGTVYQVSSAGCQDLGVTNALAIAPATGVGSRLCVGDTARISVAGSTFPQGPCLARIDRILTPEQVEALPSRQRP